MGVPSLYPTFMLNPYAGGVGGGGGEVVVTLDAEPDITVDDDYDLSLDDNDFDIAVDDDVAIEIVCE